METFDPSRPPIQPAASPRPGRLKKHLSILAVVAGIGTYWYAFPNGILNATAGTAPSAGTSACLGLIKSPLCFVFGTSSTDTESAPFDAVERHSRVQALAEEHGVRGKVSLSGSPYLTAEEDEAGYLHWLGHASESDFEMVLDHLRGELAFSSFAGEEVPQ